MKAHDCPKPAIAFLVIVVAMLFACDPAELKPVDPNDDLTLLTFSTSSFTMAENSTSGTVIQITLSKPATENSTLWVSVADNYTSNGTGEMLGSVYRTDPEVVDDDYGSHILLRLQKDAQQVEFKVFAVDNKVINSYKCKVEFLVFDGRNFMATNTCTVTIEDDE